jgi:hypothetical protein
MIDYGESIIKIKILQREAHDALLDRDWQTACDKADEIIVAARSIRVFCLSELEKVLTQ